MRIGLAAWHYPHRTPTENVRYFIDCGYGSVSLHGEHMYAVARDPKAARELAEALMGRDVVLTVHGKLPVDHTETAVAAYRARIDAYAAWQERYGLIGVLSFDVHDAVRDNVTEYVEYALERVSGARIALEDFGLNERELAQLAPFRGNARFGYLVDVGHLYIRLCGKNSSSVTLLKNTPLEHTPSAAPG